MHTLSSYKYLRHPSFDPKSYLVLNLSADRFQTDGLISGYLFPRFSSLALLIMTALLCSAHFPHHKQSIYEGAAGDHCKED